MNGALHIFPTLACTGGCKYCAIIPSEGKAMTPDCRYTSPREWAMVLNRRRPSALYITGGEPFMYRDLDVIVNAVQCPVWVYTNGVIDPTAFLIHVSRPGNLRIRLSFHPLLGFGATVGSAKKFMEAGVQVSIHAVETSPLMKTWVSRFRTMGMLLYLDPNFQNVPHWNGSSKVHCHLPNAVVGPDMLVYPCTSKLVRGVDPMFSLDSCIKIDENITYPCNEPLACCACDRAFNTLEDRKS